MGKRAVLLLAHGTPDSVEEIPEYLRNVVSGRPMPQSVVEEIQHRYSLIGRSPLTELTFEQGKLLEELLASESPGAAAKVYVGMRNWRPYIPDVVKQMRADGVTEAAVICLAPQNSRTSVGLYRRTVEAEVGELKIDFTAAWADHPLLADAFAERLQVTLGKLTAEVGEPVPVLFTAHSVPSRTLEATETQSGDTYAQDARHTAELVAARVPELKQWHFAFQSQGASGGEWIGPTVESTIDSLAAQGAKTIILQPIGFLCDHVEILYDIDIAFREYAAKLGMRLERPESLNASPTLARALGDLVRQSFARL
jgi:protoporphyrin/coproporphyrin ferrochelatase